MFHTNLDAGQPEVVQRGSPWYEKKSFSSLVQNILIKQILTFYHVSLHNPDIPTHTLVLADRCSLSTVRYPLLDACIWNASRNPLLAKFQFTALQLKILTRFLLISYRCLLLVNRHKSYGTSSFSLINVRCSWYHVAQSELYIQILASCFL